MSAPQGDCAYRAYDEHGAVVLRLAWVDEERGLFGQYLRDSDGRYVRDQTGKRVEIVRHGRLRFAKKVV